MLEAFLECPIHPGRSCALNMRTPEKEVRPSLVYSAHGEICATSYATRFPTSTLRPTWPTLQSRLQKADHGGPLHNWQPHGPMSPWPCLFEKFDMRNEILCQVSQPTGGELPVVLTRRLQDRPGKKQIISKHI